MQDDQSYNTSPTFRHMTTAKTNMSINMPTATRPKHWGTIKTVPPALLTGTPEHDADAKAGIGKPNLECNTSGRMRAEGPRVTSPVRGGKGVTGDTTAFTARGGRVAGAEAADTTAVGASDMGNEDEDKSGIQHGGKENTCGDIADDGSQTEVGEDGNIAGACIDGRAISGDDDTCPCSTEEENTSGGVAGVCVHKEGNAAGAGTGTRWTTMGNVGMNASRECSPSVKTTGDEGTGSRHLADDTVWLGNSVTASYRTSQSATDRHTNVSRIPSR